MRSLQQNELIYMPFLSPALPLPSFGMHHHGSRIVEKTHPQRWYMMIVVCAMLMALYAMFFFCTDQQKHQELNIIIITKVVLNAFYGLKSFTCPLKIYAIPVAVQTVWVCVVIRVETYKSTHKAAYPNEQHCYLFAGSWHSTMHFVEYLVENHVIKSMFSVCQMVQTHFVNDIESEDKCTMQISIPWFPYASKGFTDCNLVIQIMSKARDCGMVFGDSSLTSWNLLSRDVWSQQLFVRDWP